MQKHEYTVRRELLDFTRNPQLIKRLQSCLALVVFHHIFLVLMIRRLDTFHKCICTDGLQSHPGMNLVNLYRKLIFNSLDLEKDVKIVKQLRVNTHGQILPQTFELVAYPAISCFIPPVILELHEGFLKNGVRTNCFWFGFAG